MLLFLLWACAPSEDTATPSNTDPCEPGDAPTLEIGKGELSYTPMESDDGLIELVHGPQGGFHLALSLQATFLDDSGPAVGHITGSIDGEILADISPYLNFRCDGPQGVEVAWGALLVYDAQPTDLDGKETIITATVTDAAGTTLTATTTAIIFDPNL